MADANHPKSGEFRNFAARAKPVKVQTVGGGAGRTDTQHGRRPRAAIHTITMRELGSFEEAHGRALAGAQRLVAGVKKVVAEPVDSVADGIARLASLRKLAHDQLMVLQREQMIIGAAQWLVKNGMADAGTRWQWSPRPGADAQLDLIGRAGERVVACAQVAAAEEPGGMVDAQMRRALSRLAESDGRRHYFVRTAAMKRRAATRVAKEGWDIAVVHLAAPLMSLAEKHASLLGSASLAARGE